MDQQSSAAHATLPIVATVVFSPDGCMIGINAIGQDASFHLRDGEIVTASGEAIAWPSDDAKRRALALLKADPEAVFVAEFGPLGPIAEHAITVPD